MRRSAESLVPRAPPGDATPTVPLPDRRAPAISRTANRRSGAAFANTATPSRRSSATPKIHTPIKVSMLFWGLISSFCLSSSRDLSCFLNLFILLSHFLPFSITFGRLMLHSTYKLSEADWCALVAAKGYAARVTVEYRRSQRREQSVQIEEQVINTVPSRSEGVQAVVETAEVPCQTEIQCAGEWEAAVRVAKRHADLSCKATAAARKTLLEGETAPCLRKATHPVKPEKSAKFISELPPKPT